MPRGFTWGVYTDDAGNDFALQVDADRFEDPERGWAPAASSGLFPLPRGWLPRRALGVDASGRRQQVVVPTVVSPLWTGEATSFTIEADDLTLQVVTVTELRGERARPRVPA